MREALEGDGEIFVSWITAWELGKLIAKKRRAASEEQEPTRREQLKLDSDRRDASIRRFLEPMQNNIIQLHELVWATATEIWLDARGVNMRFSVEDLLILSTASCHGRLLLTSDRPLYEIATAAGHGASVRLIEDASKSELAQEWT